MACQRSGLITSLMTATLALGAAHPVTAEAKGKSKVAVASVFDAAKRKRTKHELTPNLSYSAYANARFLGERDINRDDAIRDASDELGLYVGVVGRAQLSSRIMAFAHGELSLKDKSTHARSYGRIMDPRLKEALVAISISDAVTVRVGRLRFSDKTKWVADASVDGLHIAHKTNTRVLEFAALRGTEDNTSTYVMAHMGRVDAAAHWGGLALGEIDGDAKRLHLTGYYATQTTRRFSYSVNVGAIWGDAANGKRAGFGFDLRAVRKLGDHKLKPQLMFGLAYGSSGFQQSGLHSNKTYDGGQTQCHRYGFTTQAELTNIAVASVGVGIRPSRKMSADLIVSGFLQPSPIATTTLGRIAGETTGKSRFLGTEISAVGAYRPTKKTKFELGVGRIMPGPAYRDQSTTTRLFTRFSDYLRPFRKDLRYDPLYLTRQRSLAGTWNRTCARKRQRALRRRGTGRCKLCPLHRI